MISIKSMKKEILFSNKESSPNIPVEKNAEIIDGGIELIDIIYNCIAGDSVGMIQMEACTDIFERQNSILDKELEDLSQLDKASSSISEIVSLLYTLASDEKKAVNEMCQTITDINQITDSMLAACQVYSVNQVGNLNAVYSMKQLLSQAKQQADTTTPEFLQTITNMEAELKKLEGYVSISYAKNDRYLHNIEKLCTKCNYYQNQSITYEEKTEKILFRVTKILEQLNDVNDLIKQVKTVDQSISQIKEINNSSIQTLTERKEHNAIMLNDLVSFLMQLKSIMTYLKKEPKMY